MNPEISIVIINYNRADLTIQCVRSIYEKTKNRRFEIIVVDNNSSESDLAELKEIEGKVKMIRSPENLGFAKGNNLGIKHASADTLLLLNNDTELLNDAISLAYEKLRANENLAVIGAQLTWPDGQIQQSAVRFMTIPRQLAYLFWLNKILPSKFKAKYFLGNYFDYKNEIEPDWLWGAFYMFRRKLLEELPANRLPDELFMYGEDLQWAYEIRKTGKKILYYPEAKVLHYVGQSNYQDLSSASNANVKYVIRKYKGRLYSFILFQITGILIKLSRFKNPSAGKI